MSTTPTREQEIQEVLKQYPLTYFIAAAALFIVIGILICAALFGQGEHATDYFSNVYLTIISTAFTVIVIDRLNRRRDEQREERELKAQLLRDASSISNEIAKNAVHQIRRRGWLEGDIGLLKGTDLIRANLSDANLRGANLSGARLGTANLSDAKLGAANLRGSDLTEANLSGAELKWANLRNANLELANLSGVELSFANLSGADLKLANLSGANLTEARYDEKTTLPDNTTWTSDTDLSRFTNPAHPNFWLSNDRID